MAWIYLLLLVALIAATYGLLLRRLATIAQPHRLKLAEIGEKYIALSRNPKEKAQITFYLDNAFNPLIATTAAFLLPLVCITAIFKAISPDFVPSNEDEHDRIMWLFTASVVAANPIFGTILAIEAIIVLLFVGNVTLSRKAIRVVLNKRVASPWSRWLPAH